MTARSAGITRATAENVDEQPAARLDELEPVEGKRGQLIVIRPRAEGTAAGLRSFTPEARRRRPSAGK